MRPKYKNLLHFHSPSISAALHLFEAQILVFPVLVVLLAGASFFFGGHCAPWQWWISVVGMMFLPICRNENEDRWRIVLIADSLFLGFLFVLWCLSPWMLDRGEVTDTMRYHLPTIRLLIEGWNPVSDPQAFDILKKLRLEPVGQAWVSVAFLAKTTGVFNACAAFFIRDPLAVTFPIVGFLSLSCLFSALRSSGRHPLLGVISALVLLRLATNTTYVDESLAFASGGLLFAMSASLNRGCLLPLQLGVFTFWMANCKLPGCAAATVFWIVFAVAFWRKHGSAVAMTAAKTTILVAGAVLFVSCVVSFNPYGTSFRDYRHPLYPLKTVDAERFPLMNIPADCKIGNDDWNRMDYWGAWFNSYTVPRFVRAWYNRKLGRTDFAPHQYIWDYSWKDTGKRSPISYGTRFRIWASVLVLLAFPRWRPFALMFILGLSVFPKQYVGYLRYYPWVAGFQACAVVAALEWMATRRPWSPFFSLPVFSISLLVLLHPVARHRFSDYLNKARELKTYRPYVTTAYSAKWQVPGTIDIEGKPLYPEGKAHMNNAILLMRSLGRPKTEVRFRTPGETEGLTQTRFGYYIDSIDDDRPSVPGPMRSLVHEFKTAVKTIVADYPLVLLQKSGIKSTPLPPMRMRAIRSVVLPDATDSPPGSGFTCTGLAHDDAVGVFLVGNIGKAMPSSNDFKSSIVYLSSDFQTNLWELPLHVLFPDMKDIQGLGINQTDRSFWIASCGENRIRHVGQDGRDMGSFPFHRPSGLAYDGQSDTLWILNDSELSHVATNGTVLASIPCAIPGQDQLFLDEKRNRLYMTAGADYNGSGFVYAIDPENGKVDCKYELADSHAIEGIWINAQERLLLVLNDGFYHSAKIPTNQIQFYPLQ